jgi:proteasome lid subunit RPN8/RPN11
MLANMPPPSVILGSEVHAAVVAATHEAGARELAGLLAGHREPGGCVVTAFVPLVNTAAADDHFAVDPIEFARAEAALRARGRDWLGFVHSHPRGTAAPSRTDHAELWRGCVQMIVASGTFAAFWLEGERCTPLPLRIAAANEVA